MFPRRATGGGTAPSRLLNTSVNNVARTRQQLPETSLQGLLGASMIPTLFTASSVAEGPAGSGERHDRLCRADARPSDPGFITDALDYRWLFYVNRALGLAIPVLVPFSSRSTSPILRRSRRPTTPASR